MTKYIITILFNLKITLMSKKMQEVVKIVVTAIINAVAVLTGINLL